MEIFKKSQKNKPQIVIVTKDWSGLGFSQLCADASYPVIMAYNMEEGEEKEDEYKLVGEGMVERVKLSDLLKDRKSYKDAYFFWDQNFASDIADMLRGEGFKVLGGNVLSDKLEHDRKFGTDLVEAAGLEIPPTTEFSDVPAALEFLDQNEDKAYVFKPDGNESAYATYVPDSVKPENANRELYDYLLSQDGEPGTFILQERKDGVEVNIEYFLFDGEPFFAHANFECKRKLNKDEGEMCGCAQDIDFTVPLHCKLAKNTLDKLVKMPEFKNYTGPVDMNIIVADNEFWFLEFCCRQGYNSSPNLFVNLAMAPFPELLVKWLDGDILGFADNFRAGFGATVSLRIDHPRMRYPFFIPDDYKKFFFFDQYQEGEKYFLAGYGEEVGIVCAHGYTIQAAAEQCLRDTDRINYPCHSCRTDLDKKDYDSSPQLRFEAMQAMKMFDV